jgi:hypothetical protein
MLLGDMPTAALKQLYPVGVELNVRGPRRGHVVFVEDRLDQTFRHARFTIDALSRIDVKHLIVLIETLRRTNGNAVGVLAITARLANDIGHEKALLSG